MLTVAMYTDSVYLQLCMTALHDFLQFHHLQKYIIMNIDLPEYLSVPTLFNVRWAQVTLYSRRCILIAVDIPNLSLNPRWHWLWGWRPWTATTMPGFCGDIQHRRGLLAVWTSSTTSVAFASTPWDQCSVCSRQGLRLRRFYLTWYLNSALHSSRLHFYTYKY